MRKSIFKIFALIFVVASSCNFPFRSPPRFPAPIETTYPGNDDIQKTSTFLVQIPDSQQVPHPNNPLDYDSSRFVQYSAQSGDTLNVVAAHFSVTPDEILSSQPIPGQGLLPNGQVLVIPRLPENPPFTQFLLSDIEVVNSPCGREFNIQEFINSTNGRLSTFSQKVDTLVLSGADVIKLASDNTSVNPQVLLAFIEFRSHWVLDNPEAPDMNYPLGMYVSNNEGLFKEIALAAKLINMGYYGWREGTITELTFSGGGSVRIAPDLNAGTVALQYLFARLFKQSTWENALYGPTGFLATYQSMFEANYICTQNVKHIFPDGLQIPILELPFAAGEEWVLTGGLHNDWNTGTPLGALDFAPNTDETSCEVSFTWVQASAAGIVTRSDNGVLQLALVDETGTITGWDLIYIHIAEKDRPNVGTLINTNDRIGHPSCEGGSATGTNVHLARMYHGEWIGAGDPFPLVLSGWLALPGEKPYKSQLIKNDQVVTSSSYGSSGSTIIR